MTQADDHRSREGAGLRSAPTVLAIVGSAPLLAAITLYALLVVGHRKAVHYHYG